MFSCDQCLKEFIHRPFLLRHKRTLHAISEVKEYEIYCKLIKSNLKKHFASCNTNNENVTVVPLFECNICSKKFPSKKTLKKYKKQVTKEPYKELKPNSIVNSV